MLNKLGSNLLLIAAVTCAPLLLLQGIWLAVQATPFTLILIVGTTLLGFGLLFMGIGLLQQAFVGLGDQISLPQGTDALSVLAQLGLGLLMTVLMQSSSAAMQLSRLDLPTPDSPTMAMNSPGSTRRFTWLNTGVSP